MSKKKKETKKKEKNLGETGPKFKFPLLYIGLALFIYLIISTYMLQQPQKGEEIAYSKFKEFVAQKKAANLIITPGQISGELKGVSWTELSPGKETPPGKPQAPEQFITIRVEDPDLVSQLESSGIAYSGGIEAKNFWGDLIFWGALLVLPLVIWIFVLRRINPARDMMQIGKSKAKVYVESKTGTTFADVAGCEEAKEELEEVVDFLKEPQRFTSIGGHIPKGILLVGPPGTGKTLLARAVAGEAGVAFLSMSGSDFIEMFVGVGAARVRDLFQQAEKLAPSIIFIDEIDALGKVRSVAPMPGGHEEREHTLQQLLVEMDGFDTKKGVIILAATNRPEILDPALLRPGRFDRHVVVDRPDIKGREAILKVHTRSMKMDKDVELSVIAARTPGFAGADLANLANEAALLAARRRKKTISMAEFEEAIDRIVAGLEKRSRMINPKEKKIVAYHESGHAVVAASFPGTDKVHRVSVIPRGIAALGYTLQLPTEDRYLMTYSELMTKLAVLLGGRAAEDLIFNELSTGAANDLERATNIAEKIVKEYGMSEKLGPMVFDSTNREQFLTGMFQPPFRKYSEKTAQMIDEEITRLIKDTYERAHKLLEEKRDRLERLAKLLCDKEVVEGEELEDILSGKA